MTQYIDADNLLEKLHRIIDYCEKDRKVNAVSALFQVGDAIMDCKTADVQEVRHGKWERSSFSKTFHLCSVCRAIWNRTFEYCPHCGAKMDGNKAEAIIKELEDRK